MSELMPHCSAIERPHRLFDPATTTHGLRVARTNVIAGQRFVDVWLYQTPPAVLADPTRWTILAPPGAASVEVSAAVVDVDHVRLSIVGLPDPTRYRLEVDPPAGLEMDPLRLRLPVRLRPECPDLGNCFGVDAAPTTVAPSPVHDYTARDWRALRSALVEFHRRQRPDADTSIADPTITVAELFAHIGDLLHYRIDRVAAETYLSTARWRTSVARHARLVDYQLADAVAARTHVHLSIAPGGPPVAVQAGDRVTPGDDERLSFVVESDRQVVDALGEIAIYDWGEAGCCLPAGTTSAVLVRPLPADALGANWLAVGDRIVFEVVDPGDAAAHDDWRARVVDWPVVDGQPGFRAPLPSRMGQVVELVTVDPIADPLEPSLALFRVGWREPLERSYPASADRSRGAAEITIVRGNLVPAHHGVLVDGPPEATLQPVSPDWAEHLPLGERTGVPDGYLLAGAPEGLARRDDGTPYRVEVDVTLPSGAGIVPINTATHLGVTPGQLAVTVEEESWRPPLIRFRTGSMGTDPPAGSVVAATYEAGGGAAANLPSHTLSRLQRNGALTAAPPAWQDVAGVTARNPVPSVGGADAEPLDRARRDAPQAFAADPRRAVLPGDHAAAARSIAGIDRASAHRTWTGAWPMIVTVVDVLDGDADAALAEVNAHLDGLRMIGQEVATVAGTGVGLVVGLDVCVVAGVDTESVRRRILARLRPGTDDAPGLFHPDALRLGGTIHMSTVIAAAAATPGVDAVAVTSARRLAEPPGTVHDVLTFENDEIPVLDDDPARPERGRIELTMRGGR